MMLLIFSIALSWGEVPRLAVLDFSSSAPKLSRAFRYQLADEVRAGALQMSKNKNKKLDIFTRENMLQMVKDMGKDCSNKSCEIEFARTIGADLVVSGNLLKVDRDLVMGLRLHETKSGKLLASEKCQKRNKVALLECASKAGKHILSTGLGLPKEHSLEELQKEQLAFEQHKKKALQKHCQQAKSEWPKYKALIIKKGPVSLKSAKSFLKSYGSLQVQGYRIQARCPEVIQAQTIVDGGHIGESVLRGKMGYEMIWLPPGKLEMGSSGGEDDELPIHEVELDYSFYMGRYEVDQQLYRRITEHHYSKVQDVRPALRGAGDCQFAWKKQQVFAAHKPVSCISWLEVVQFANWLSEKEGLKPCYTIYGDLVEWPKGIRCEGYRLPTEAEWEYAAKAGKKKREKSLSQIAWYQRKKLSSVGKKRPNPWGLYDMLGNVWEWVWEPYGRYERGKRKNPISTRSLIFKKGHFVGEIEEPQKGLVRVLRGGGATSRAKELRIANREWLHPKQRNTVVGFRLVRSVVAQ